MTSGAAKVPPALVRGRDHRSERRIGPQRERQRARRRRIRAADLDERRGAKPPAHRPKQLVPRPRAPGEAHPGAQPSKDVEPALARIEQVLERHADVVVAPRHRRGQRRRERPVGADEGAQVDFVRQHRLGERVRAGRAHGVEPHRRVLIGAVHACEPAQRPPGQGHGARDLHRPSAEALAIALAGVGRARVAVELISGEGPAEAVERELHPTHEAMCVQRDQMGQRGEIVSRCEVHAGRRGVRTFGQAPRLEDAVVGCRVAQRRIPRAGSDAELAEQRGGAARGRGAPAILVLVPRADVVVPHPAAIPGARLQLVASEAAAGDLDLPLGRHGAASRHEVHCRAKGVPAQQHRGTVGHVHVVHVLERQQVEVHLVGVGLIHPHAVQVHRHSLGQADGRRDLKSPERHVQLARRTELVRRRDARQLLERVRERAHPARIEVRRVQRGGTAGEPARQLAHGGEPDAADHDGGQGVGGEGVGLLGAGERRQRGEDECAGKQLRIADWGLRICRTDGQSAIHNRQSAIS